MSLEYLEDLDLRLGPPGWNKFAHDGLRPDAFQDVMGTRENLQLAAPDVDLHQSDARNLIHDAVLIERCNRHRETFASLIPAIRQQGGFARIPLSLRQMKRCRTIVGAQRSGFDRNLFASRRPIDRGPQ